MSAPEVPEGGERELAVRHVREMLEESLRHDEALFPNLLSDVGREQYRGRIAAWKRAIAALLPVPEGGDAERERLAAAQLERIAAVLKRLPGWVLEAIAHEADVRMPMVSIANAAKLLRSPAESERIAALEAELAEYEHLVKMTLSRERPWIEQWQRETGRPGVLPDYGRLLEWLAAKATPTGVMRCEGCGAYPEHAYHEVRQGDVPAPCGPVSIDATPTGGAEPEREMLAERLASVARWAPNLERATWEVMKLLPAPAPSVAPEGVQECTGMAASWCPIHGTCTCPRSDDGDRPEMDAADCPLHRFESDHAEAIGSVAPEGEREPDALEPIGWMFEIYHERIGGRPINPGRWLLGGYQWEGDPPDWWAEFVAEQPEIYRVRRVWAAAAPAAVPAGAWSPEERDLIVASLMDTASCHDGYDAADREMARTLAARLEGAPSAADGEPT